MVYSLSNELTGQGHDEFTEIVLSILAAIVTLDVSGHERVSRQRVVRRTPGARGVSGWMIAL